MKRLDHYWYNKNFTSILLLPISWLFRLIVAVRKWLYDISVLSSERLEVPVIVVGNISVGGTGKTPLTVELVKYLRLHGFAPGIISRGYGGTATYWPQHVKTHSEPALVGDEAVLMARNCKCPVVVGPDRIAAAKELLDKHACDVIISDDGLQHYQMQRDMEIVVIDGDRRFGNGYCLPAGPLREPLSRLQKVDFLVCNGGPSKEAKEPEQAQDRWSQQEERQQEGVLQEEAQAEALKPEAPQKMRQNATKLEEHSMQLNISKAVNLLDESIKLRLDEFTENKVHAVAGIGNPQRFFNALKLHNLSLIEHSFDDHHAFVSKDLVFDDNYPILMTEKDAVKCKLFARKNIWYVPVQTSVSEALLNAIINKLGGRNGQKAA